MRKLPLAFFALVLTGIFAACGSESDDDATIPPNPDGGDGSAFADGQTSGSTGTSGTGTSSGSTGTSGTTSGASSGSTSGASSGLLDGGTLLDGSQICF